MDDALFEVIDSDTGRFIKAWKRGVRFEDKAVEQLKNAAQLPFIYKYIAAMPDTHWGIGATIGSVLPTKGAIVPAAVGVDIGCGMLAARLMLTREDFGDNLHDVRIAIEKAVPTGRTDNGGEGDRGAWHDVPEHIRALWNREFVHDYEALCELHPGMRSQNTARHLGTMGTGNHFLELATDEEGKVWVMLHSGSRGLGNRIGTYFIKVAQELCEKWFIKLPDRDLAYLVQGTPEFNAYLKALNLAQKFAWKNRELMYEAVSGVLLNLGYKNTEMELVHCHHNYAALEHHFGEDVFVTRKGAVRAREGDMGIIPGSMGAKSYIVRGKGSKDSFHSCSHGAGRAMGREEAKRRYTVEQHAAATEGIECDKSAGTLDETPAAYKPIDDVISAQADLIEPVHILRQFLCVKGVEDPNARKYGKKKKE